MTKRIVSVFLVLVLCVSLAVPAFAASFDTLIKLEDKSASKSNYSANATVYDASTGSSSVFGYTVPTDGAAIIVFYGVGEESYPSARLFKSLSSASWAKNSKLNFIAIDFARSSQADVKSFVSKYDTAGVFKKSYYNTASNSLIAWYYNYVKNNGDMSSISGSSISHCFVIIVSSESGKKYIRYANDGVDSASQISEALSKFMDTSELAGGGYDGFLNSGNTAAAKLSKTEINKILGANPMITPSTDAGYFDVAPVTSGSYKTGTVKTEYLQAAVNRLSALRRIAGLPAVTMDATLNSQAQYGAVLLANAEFAHEPEKPADMSADFFTKGRAATESSNIAAGRQLTATPDGFMRDEGTHNLSVMGHRRWQLNPNMAKVGFGFAINENNAYYASQGSGQYKYYTDEKCQDSSGANIDYRFISWPASGNFPIQLFAYDTAWSVTVNPAYYQTPDIASVKVTLTRDSDSSSWTFSNSESYALTDYGKFFTVETKNYGVANCIIFRPDGISAYDGVYTVVIEGLKDSFGNAVSLSYKVDFFDSDDYNVTSPGWVDDSGYRYYYDESLQPVTGWQTISGQKYCFNSYGQMLKGLKKVGSYYYYFGTDGVMKTGWQSIKRADGKTYKHYFSYKGIMCTGWQNIKNSKGVAYKYYFGTNGCMVTGWQSIKNSKGVAYKYYFGDNGYMRTGWQSIKNSKGVAYKYYFHTNGVMLTGWQSIKNSKGVAYKYYFHTNGVMLTGWQSIKNAKGVAYKYYFGANGVMRTGWQTIKNAKGVAYKYYFHTNGVMLTGWQKLRASNGKYYWYYFFSNGVNAVNRKVTIGKKTYNFNKYGICTNP